MAVRGRPGDASGVWGLSGCEPGNRRRGYGSGPEDGLQGSPLRGEWSRYGWLETHRVALCVTEVYLKNPRRATPVCLRDSASTGDVFVESSMGVVVGGCGRPQQVALMCGRIAEQVVFERIFYKKNC